MKKYLTVRYLQTANPSISTGLEVETRLLGAFSDFQGEKRLMQLT
jgi:hypothetical protein